MAEASVKRTFGDLGEYMLYGVGEVSGGAATYFAAGSLLGEEYGEVSNRAAAASAVAAVGLFLAASQVQSERAGDFLATSSLGALGAAIAWKVGVRQSIEEFTLCSCNESRRMVETEEWASPRQNGDATATNGQSPQTQTVEATQPASTPRSRREETDAWG